MLLFVAALNPLNAMRRTANANEAGMPPSFVADLQTAKTNADEALRLAKIQKLYEGFADSVGTVSPPAVAGTFKWQTYLNTESPEEQWIWDGTSWAQITPSNRIVLQDFPVPPGIKNNVRYTYWIQPYTGNTYATDRLGKVLLVGNQFIPAGEATLTGRMFLDIDGMFYSVPNLRNVLQFYGCPTFPVAAELQKIKDSLAALIMGTYAGVSPTYIPNDTGIDPLVLAVAIPKVLRSAAKYYDPSLSVASPYPLINLRDFYDDTAGNTFLEQENSAIFDAGQGGYFGATNRRELAQIYMVIAAQLEWYFAKPENRQAVLVPVTSNRVDAAQNAASILDSITAALA
jgi:hypothetical protein